jgi:ribosome biogenesis protein ENP2
MHGYFLSLKLYQTARLIANPQSYQEHRERVVAEKLSKQAESRIRAKKDQPKVNKALAERIRRAEEREAEKEAKKKQRLGEEAAEEAGKDKRTILEDPRFKDLWENPDFEVDEDSREFGLLNPATANNNVSSNQV